MSWHHGLPSAQRTKASTPGLMRMLPDTQVAEITTFGPPCDATGSSLRGMSESTLPDIDSTPRRVLDAGLAGGDEGHHGAQLLPDLLDRMRLALLAESFEVGPTRLVLRDPFLREGAALDLIKDRLHLGPHRLIDDAGPAG